MRLERLKELSKKTRVRQSEYLREAIADLLAKYSPQAQ
jgi:predicted DNA-binding protein